MPGVSKLLTRAGNLDAVFWTLTLPYALALNGATSRRHQQVFFAKLFEAKADAIHSDGAEDTVDEAAVHEQANQQIKNESTELRAEARDVLGSVLERDNALTDGARELLRQGAVLVWGAFEVLAGDLFRSLLNHYPMLAIGVLKDLEARKLFQVKLLELENLEMYGFDLSSHMGDILTKVGRVDSVPAIKAAFSALSPDRASLLEALGDRELWVLSQRRNLILHKRSVVDAEYLRNTNESVEIGSKLVVSPEDIRRYRTVIKKAGLKLVQQANCAASERRAEPASRAAGPCLTSN